MAFTYDKYNSNQEAGSSTTLTIASAGSIPAGALSLVFAFCTNAPGTITIADTVGGAYTSTGVTFLYLSYYGTIFYRFNSGYSAANSMTITYGNSVSQRAAIYTYFILDLSAGYTASAGNGATTGTFQSSDITTVGTDSLVVGCYYCPGSSSSGELINDAAVGGNVDTTYMSMSYSSIATAGALHYQGTGALANHGVQIIAFNSFPTAKTTGAHQMRNMTTF